MLENGGLLRRALGGAFAGGVAFGVGSLLAVVQVPILLHLWSPNILAEWTTLMAAAALVTVVDVGHQSYVGNKFCAVWNQPREVLAGEVGSGVRAAALLGGIEVVIGVGLIGFSCFSEAFSSWVRGGGAAVALLLYLVYWAIFGSVGGLLVRLYLPSGMYAWGQWLGIFSRFAMFCGLVLGASLGGGVLGAMLGQLVFGTVFNVFLLWDLKRRFSDLMWPWRGGTWMAGLRNLRSAATISVNSLAEQATGNGLVLLLGGVLGPLPLVTFSTLRTVANTGLQAATLLLGPVVPDLIRFRGNEQAQKIAGIWSVAWSAGSFAFAVGLLLSIFVLEPIYLAWTRGAVRFEPHVFVLLALSVAVRIWASPVLTYIVGLNFVGAQAAVCWIRVVVTAAVAVIWVEDFGLLAAASALCLGELAGAVVAVALAHRDFRSFSVMRYSSAPTLAIGQILFATVIWLIADWLPEHRVTLVAVGAIVSGFLARAQWRVLPEQFRSRVAALWDHA